MAAFFGIERQKNNVKKIGVTVTIPDNCFARLMYYLKIVNTCIPNLDLPKQYTTYGDYEELDGDDEKVIIALAALLSPDDLNDKVHIQVDDNHELLGNGSGNEIYEVTIARQFIGGISNGQEGIVIDGERKQVRNFFYRLQSYFYVRTLQKKHIA